MLSAKVIIDEKCDREIRPSALGHFLAKLGSRNRSKSPSSEFGLRSKTLIPKKNSTTDKTSTDLESGLSVNDNGSIPAKTKVSSFARIVHRLSMNRKHGRNIFLRRKSGDSDQDFDKSRETVCSSSICSSDPLVSNLPSHISSRAAVSENDLRIVALCKEQAEINSWSSTTNTSSRSDYDLNNYRVPSYLRISCALNGYGQYKHFNNVHRSTKLLPLGIVERRMQMFNANHQDPSLKPSEKVKEMNKVVDSTTPVRQLVKHFDKLNIASDNYHLDNANVPEKPHMLTTLSNGENGYEINTEKPTEFPSTPRSSIPLSGQIFNEVLAHSTPKAILSYSLHSGLKQKLVEENTPNQMNHLQVSIVKTSKETADKVNFNIAYKKEMRNGETYKKLLNDVRNDLVKRSFEAYEILRTNESELSEYAADLLRLAAGKTNLLLKKKIEKFDELIENNLNPINGDTQSTTTDDLSGYWALIQIEMSDLYRLFRKIEKCREIGWKQPTTPENEERSFIKSDLFAENKQNHRISKGKEKTVVGREMTEKSTVAEKRRKAIAEAKRKQKELIQKNNAINEKETSLKMVF